MRDYRIRSVCRQILSANTSSHNIGGTPRSINHNLFNRLWKKMSSHGKPNRLANEKSPYLLQHAYNLVDWYAWGEEAFGRAKTENKPIFLSVGYSTCHWCHVMERESFESEKIGKLMNKYFISIKVDREERPDVDKVYMTFIQLLTKRGGWPMSVFLTPDLQPITGGTYFPPEDSQWGQPGFATVLQKVADAWRDSGDDVRRQGASVASALIAMQEGDNDAVSTGARLTQEDVNRATALCYEHLRDSFDPRMGGFGRAPKFPQPVNLEFLLHYYWRESDQETRRVALNMVEKTLECMARGGIHDHVAKGFHRYSTDAKWHVPHFEKMLYDQAQLAVAFAGAYQISKKARYATVLRWLLSYVERDLSHPSGGFYSAEDADSLPPGATGDAKKREGAFCVWTKQEIDTLLGAETLTTSSLQGTANAGATLAQLFTRHFSVQEEGNADPRMDPHGELQGQNVLLAQTSTAETGAHFGLSEADADAAVERACQLLFTARLTRPKPHLDDKMLTAWNGLMISGFARASVALCERRYAERATRVVELVREHLTTEDGFLLRSVYNAPDGAVAQTATPILGFGDDYAFFIAALLDLYEANFDSGLIKWAVDLQKRMDDLFWDHDGNTGYFLSNEGDSSILVRMKEDQDGAEPCTNSVAATNLVRLSHLLGTAVSDYQHKAQCIFAAFRPHFAKHPFIVPKMLCALQSSAGTSVQIVIVGERNVDATEKLLHCVNDVFLPQKTLIHLSPKDTDNWLRQNVSHLANLTTIDGQPTAYVCRDFACSLPVHKPDDLRALIDNAKQS